MTLLAELIDRLAQATGPTRHRDLDRAIAAALGATSTYDLATCPEYTKSVPAAMTLCPTDWNIILGWHQDNREAAACVGPNAPDFALGESTVHSLDRESGLALALCLASLRAIDSGRTE